jgi:hypothetical protein
MIQTAGTGSAAKIQMVMVLLVMGEKETYLLIGFHGYISMAI